jgi:molybdopterin-containing oxidoreductase family iron-sulfur binding subunit
LVLAINSALNSDSFIGAGIRQIRKGSNEVMTQFLADLKGGAVHTLIMSGVNPAYSLPNAKEFVESLKKVNLSVAVSLKEDETASVSKIAIGTTHYLESWNDLVLTKGTYALTQPTINPLFKQTKQFQELLLDWTGNSVSYYDYLRLNSASYTSGSSWNKVVHDGVLAVGGATVGTAVSDFVSAASNLSQSVAQKGLELILYTKTGLGDGQQANNPWLQEFPDPITRVSWDNYITISKADAEAKELVNYNVADGGLNGSYVTLTVDGASRNRAGAT